MYYYNFSTFSYPYSSFLFCALPLLIFRYEDLSSYKKMNHLSSTSICFCKQTVLCTQQRLCVCVFQCVVISQTVFVWVCKFNKLISFHTLLLLISGEFSPALLLFCTLLLLGEPCCMRATIVMDKSSNFTEMATSWCHSIKFQRN